MAVNLTQMEARRFLLNHQGLNQFSRKSSEQGILDYFERVGSIQFDPLDKAGKNPELVLLSRFPHASPRLLYSLLYEERKLLDGWDKMMSIYRVEDWPFFRRRRERMTRWLHESPRGKPVLKVREDVLGEIRERGPLSSKELSVSGRTDWAWAPATLARAALEGLFHAGDLVVHHREGTRKYYDLAERTLPPDILQKEDPNKSEEDFRRWHTVRRLGSVGLLPNKSPDPWLGTFKTPERAAVLEGLVEEGRVTAINIKGLNGGYFARTEDLERAAGWNEQVHFIAPLDNLIWDRKMLEDLFGFRYRWEVYKPASEREFGYYVLPVLRGDRFIGRMEPVRDRKRRALVIKNWWWEEDFSPAPSLGEEIQAALERYKKALGLESLIWECASVI